MEGGEARKQHSPVRRFLLSEAPLALDPSSCLGIEGRLPGRDSDSMTRVKCLAIGAMTVGTLGLLPSFTANAEGRAEATLGVPLDARAGVAKAGMLCLPSGRLHVSDFVASEQEFSNQVGRAFEREVGAETSFPSPAVPSVRIVLTSIDAELCARKYGAFGMGNRRALSGRVEFHFAWSAPGYGDVRQELISIDVAKSSGKPAEAILPDALAVLATRTLAVRNGVKRP